MSIRGAMKPTLEESEVEQLTQALIRTLGAHWSPEFELRALVEGLLLPEHIDRLAAAAIGWAFPGWTGYDLSDDRTHLISIAARAIRGWIDAGRPHAHRHCLHSPCFLQGIDVDPCAT